MFKSNLLKTILVIFIVSFCTSFILIETAYANQNCEIDYTFYYYDDSDYLNCLDVDYNNTYDFLDDFISSTYFNYINHDTQILNVVLIDNDIYIDVSKEFLSYGGTHYETHMIEQFVLTALSIPDVNTVTILVDGKYTILTEGGIVYKKTA